MSKPRILFLDHPEGDFLAAVLFLGLYEELGPENVVCYPHKPSFFGQDHVYPSFYEAGQLGCTRPFPWMPALWGEEHSLDQVASEISEGRFDLVVVASPRAHSIGAFRDLSRVVGRSRFPTVVLCDGEDYSVIRGDLAEEVNPRVYFKRELMPEMHHSGLRVVPFPFASPIPPHPPAEKDVDVLFLGGSTWPNREECASTLRAKFGSKFVGGAGVVFPYPDYLANLARARVAVSLRGFGYDTLRFWEIPSLAGTMMVCDELPIIKPHPFVDGEHAAYFRSPEELVAVVERALSDEPWRAKVAAAGNAHLRAHHTARARARQLLDASFA